MKRKRLTLIIVCVLILCLCRHNQLIRSFLRASLLQFVRAPETSNPNFKSLLFLKWGLGEFLMLLQHMWFGFKAYRYVLEQYLWFKEAHHGSIILYGVEGGSTLGPLWIPSSCTFLYSVFPFVYFQYRLYNIINTELVHISFTHS